MAGRAPQADTAPHRTRRSRRQAGIVELTGDDRATIYGALLWMGDKLKSDQREFDQAASAVSDAWQGQ